MFASLLGSSWNASFISRRGPVEEGSIPQCKLCSSPQRQVLRGTFSSSSVFQLQWWSSTRSLADLLLPRGPSPHFDRLWVSAAYSSFGSTLGTATVNTAYQRVADCLVFQPLPGRKPRALIHFIGGAFIGAVPEVTYSLFIELLRQQDFLIVATPYNVTFEHVLAAELVYTKFQQGKDALVNGECNIPGISTNEISSLPVFSIGHSNGALLQLLIGCLFQEDLPKASVVLAFNNKPAADAVPYFEQLGPVTAQLTPLIASSPLLSLSNSLFGDSFKNLLDAASPILPSYDEETLQSLQNFVEQVPLVLEQVSRGVSEFTPAPLENRKSIGNNYRVQNTLLVKFKVDPIDESDIIEDVLNSVVQKVDGSLTKITIDGNHITPCVQDIRWEIGRVYTPFDAAAQLFRTAALSEIRETVASITSWLEQFL
ncbi:hypothetical protein GOP47_0000214 [Adiantum capillus-veneris]|uniref:Uncharacterized protein n=1 Tax=Adiantum capillus-veneris TaxID=13818 RepID=A0A9D4VCL9_ADICA|nr:hypothetical protein GOP47_0000214 [Adiantum capillus-veneris]